MDETEVLIAGAGPTGLVLALWLVRQGVKVRIADREAGPGTSSRAMAVQARTLELYRQLDLADEIVEGGLRNPAINLWVKGERRARLSFGDAGRELTPYPFVLIYPQDRHEQVLVRRLEEAGVKVERNTELMGFEQDAAGVTARLRGPAGESVCRAAWLAGCDGAHSIVRHQLGTGFEGGTYQHTFYVADVEVSGPAANGEIHVSLEDGDFAALFAYDLRGNARLIGAVRDAEVREGHTLAFEDVRQRAIASLGLRIGQVNWFSTYRVHHRVTGHYRSGRALLLGDAAHVHSPAGGQGMNTGIGDAINVAWKLAHVLRGRAPDTLIDTYETERKAFARKLVETTDRAFSFVVAEGGFADLVRTHIAPLFASAAYGIEPVRAFIAAQQARRLHHVRQRRPGLRPGPRLEAAVGIDPQLRRRDHFGRLAHQAQDVVGGGHARRVDVVDARPDGVRVGEAPKPRSSSMSERLVSMVMTSASSAAICGRMSLNSA
jgi:2-polyprenyl-6-methoxyphenol hydroxylase-like FAD-dependent oxidoreductase